VQQDLDPGLVFVIAPALEVVDAQNRVAIGEQIALGQEFARRGHEVVQISRAHPRLARADKTYTGGKGATWDCKKDHTVNINHGKGKYTFKGECKEIHINGGDNTLKIESVDELDVNGGKNTITVGTVDAININGASNKVSWKKSKSADKPAIKTEGDGNKVTQAK
jgi:hypothetical protein